MEAANISSRHRRRPRPLICATHLKQKTQHERNGTKSWKLTAEDSLSQPVRRALWFFVVFFSSSYFIPFFFHHSIFHFYCWCGCCCRVCLFACAWWCWCSYYVYASGAMLLGHLCATIATHFPITVYVIAYKIFMNEPFFFLLCPAHSYMMAYSILKSGRMTFS